MSLARLLPHLQSTQVSVAQADATFEKILEFFLLNLPVEFHPPNVKVGIICGSGLGGLVDTIDPLTIKEFAYGKIPGFSESTGEF